LTPPLNRSQIKNDFQGSNFGDAAASQSVADHRLLMSLIEPQKRTGKQSEKYSTNN
jgi:hypothetical protein